MEQRNRGGARTLKLEGKDADNELTKVVKDSNMMACEQIKGLASQITKAALFNCSCRPHP